MIPIQVEVYDDADALAAAVANRVIEIVQESVDRHGYCLAALAGGSTPKRLYQLLATDEYRTRIDWSKLHFFLGDERYVPLDHPDSNYRMARESLLDHVSIPADQWRPVPTDLEPEAAARAYEALIRKTCNTPDDEIPAFDLILLGIGGDGHTASLFPDTEALEVHDRLVVENWVPQQDSMRISFTIPLLTAARQTILMATGDDKADAVYRAIEGSPNLSETPSQVLRESEGDVIFALDQAAAAKLAS